MIHNTLKEIIIFIKSKNHFKHVPFFYANLLWIKRYRIVTFGIRNKRNKYIPAA